MRSNISHSISNTAPPLSNNTALSQPPVPPVPICPAVAFRCHPSDLFPSIPKSLTPSVKKETVQEEDVPMLLPSTTTMILTKAITMERRRQQKQKERSRPFTNVHTVVDRYRCIPAFQTTTTKGAQSKKILLLLLRVLYCSTHPRREAELLLPVFEEPRKDHRLLFERLLLLLLLDHDPNHRHRGVGVDPIKQQQQQQQHLPLLLLIPSSRFDEE